MLQHQHTITTPFSKLYTITIKFQWLLMCSSTSGTTLWDYTIFRFFVNFGFLKYFVFFINFPVLRLLVLHKIKLTGARITVDRFIGFNHIIVQAFTNKTICNNLRTFYIKHGNVALKLFLASIDYNRFIVCFTNLSITKQGCTVNIYKLRVLFVQINVILSKCLINIIRIQLVDFDSLRILENLLVHTSPRWTTNFFK